MQKESYFRWYEVNERRWHDGMPFYTTPILKNYRQMRLPKDAKPSMVLVENWRRLVNPRNWGSPEGRDQFARSAEWLLIFASLLVFPKERKIIALHLFAMSHGYVVNDAPTMEYWEPEVYLQQNVSNM